MSSSWTPLDAQLLQQSGGAFDPQQMRSLRRPPASRRQASGLSDRISILTPTTASRREFHKQLWACFVAQTWSDKELVVVETYEDEPSEVLEALAEQDERLVHVALHRLPGEDFSVGLKRNMCVCLASGDTCLNFDDDDLYADGYCEWMIGEMRRHGWGAATLSSWHNYFVRSGVCGYSDPESWDVEDLQELTETIYGYGFSYAFLRSLALCHPYPDLDFGEDAPFMLHLRSVLGDARVGLLRDEEGMCLHIIHRDSTCVDPEVSHLLSDDELESLQVSHTEAFRRMKTPWHVVLWNLMRC